MRLLHRINLDVPAGEECQFRAVIGRPEMQAAFRHDVVYGSGIHPTLAPDILPYVDQAVSLKRWGRLRLPRYPVRLRNHCLNSRIRQFGTDAIFSWSDFAHELLVQASQKTGTPLLYREGGGAWHARSHVLARRFVEAVDGAICNTHASLRMLQLKWGYEGPARVCREGVQPALMAAADEQPHRALQPRPVIGVAGRLVAGKGIGLALHALKYLRAQGVDASLRIAGGGPDEHALREQATQLGIADSVEWLGLISDMAGFYRSIDALLHPTLHEALGNVTIEASAFGVPVVATRIDGMAETVLNEKSGYTVPASESIENYGRYGGDVSTILATEVYNPETDALQPLAFAPPEGYAEALAAILTRPADHARMSQAAAAHVRDRFSFEKYIPELVTAIQDFSSGR